LGLRALSHPDHSYLSHQTRHGPKFVFVVPSDIVASKKAFNRALLEHVALGSDVDLAVVDSSTDLVQVAHQAAIDADVVVATGGDGTVSRVATGILGSGAALGIVPLGSTNIIAKSFGIPANPREAMNLVLTSDSRRLIDVGRCDDHCFLHIAGAGFDAEIFRHASLEWKRRTGWIAYLPPAVRALQLGAAEVRVTVDQAISTHTAPLVLVANGGSFISPNLSLFPGISFDDGWLDVLVFTCTTVPEMLATLASIGAGRSESSQFVTRLRGRHVRIEAEPSLWVETDGDPIGQTPRDFWVMPRALAVVTPLT
jgi:diacylglycerol kinase (ATP)